MDLRVRACIIFGGLPRGTRGQRRQRRHRTRMRNWSAPSLLLIDALFFNQGVPLRSGQLFIVGAARYRWRYSTPMQRYQREGGSNLLIVYSLSSSSVVIDLSLLGRAPQLSPVQHSFVRRCALQLALYLNARATPAAAASPRHRQREAAKSGKPPAAHLANVICSCLRNGPLIFARASLVGASRGALVQIPSHAASVKGCPRPSMAIVQQRTDAATPNKGPRFRLTKRICVFFSPFISRWAKIHRPSERRHRPTMALAGI